jgi:RNA methyltransferase, TrmH family
VMPPVLQATTRSVKSLRDRPEGSAEKGRPCGAGERPKIFFRGTPVKPLSWYKDLSDSKKRREYGFFLVEGRRAIDQIKTATPGAIDEILVTERMLDESKSFDCPSRILTDRQFSSISTSKTPQGIAAVVRVPEDAFSDELPRQTGSRLLLLEGVQDPGNVGTLVRTAAAFDFSGIVLSDKCADPFSPKAVQASAGSIMAVWT